MAIRKREEKQITLAEWIIEKTNTEAYRAGTLGGMKHFKVDTQLLKSVGGRKKFMEQVNFLEKQTEIGRTEKISFEKTNVNTDVKRINYEVAIIPQLCELENVEDTREHQLKLISAVKNGKEQVEDCEWLCTYYDNLLERLCAGKIVSEAEDELLFQCINAVAKQKEPIWERVFSARVFNDSKRFSDRKRGYKSKVCTILKNYSPYYEEEMDDDEILAQHGIHSYAQTLEWKGPLSYQIDGKNIIDTAANYYGTVLNTQTLDHAEAYALPDCKRVMTIENKANYESMIYSDNTLYVFCHGFFSPKEVRFLKHICEIVPEECEFYHWGDMDFGGICIFQFIKEKVFPKVQPYRMNALEYWNAIEAGAGIELEESKRKKLQEKDAGELAEVKKCILQTGKTIEQERLL